MTVGKEMASQSRDTPEARPIRSSLMDSKRIPAAGDPFTSVGRALPDLEDRHHACTDGVVFIGHFEHDEECGEEVEVFETVPCRRCASEA
jgi:hypothetical protein